jgi:DNA-binding beta-propeller fold protein YncE
MSQHTRIAAGVGVLAVIAVVVAAVIDVGHQPSSSQVVLPFTGLNSPSGVAVDAVGNLYVSDTGNNRVLKLRAG